MLDFLADTLAALVDAAEAEALAPPGGRNEADAALAVDAALAALVVADPTLRPILAEALALAPTFSFAHQVKRTHRC